MKVLVTGASGYIGAFTACRLIKEHRVFTLDWENPSHNYTQTNYVCDMIDYDRLQRVMESCEPNVVVHLAAFPYIWESFSKSSAYIHNNVFATLNLINAMKHVGTEKLVLASSCTAENMASPYAMSKRICERVLPGTGLSWIALRYFNVAGADVKAGLGENHPGKGRLIYNAVHEDKVTVNGLEHGTDDGSPVRDYVHVLDVAEANTAAVRAVCDSHREQIFEVGTGFGFSVIEVLNTVKEVKPVEMVRGDAREGDEAGLVSAPNKWLPGWRPQRTLRDIIKSQYEWRKNGL